MTDATTSGLVQELLRRRVTAELAEDVPRVPDGTAVPLTPAQAGIWFLTRLYPDSAEYNVSYTFELDTAPEPGTLRAHLRTLFRRHDALRLRVLERDGEPVQVDSGIDEPVIRWYDLRALAGGEARARAMEIGNERVRELLRPEEPPLVRVTALRLPAGRAQLLFVLHHLVADDWSWGVLGEELRALLAGRALPPPPAVRFLDYAHWLRDRHDEQRVRGDLAYWGDKLRGELTVLDLPKDRPRPAVASRRGHAVALEVPPDVLEGLRAVADAGRTTLFVVMLAAHKAFLLRLSGQEDLVVGTAFAGRDHPMTEPLVGCFAKAVPLRTALAESVTYRDAVARVHATVLEAQDHQGVTFERIVAHLGVTRELGIHPVFQTYFGMQTAEAVEDAGPRAGALAFLDYGSAKWDLTVTLTESALGLHGIMECSADLFDLETVERYAGVYRHVLAGVARDPDRPIGAYPLVDGEERDRILYALNRYERPDHGYRTMAEPFEEQAARTPGAVALADEQGATLTYGELNAASNRLARFLAARGAGPGTRVALLLDRGFGMFVGIYATAKCGAAYVPLEPELPDARIAFMLADTAPAVVLTERALRGRLPRGDWELVTLDADGHRWAREPAGDLDVATAPNQLSHVLYTSGSTGIPKGVACPVDGAVADILWMQGSYPYAPGETTLCKTSYGFDVSLWEIFWPLWSGARVVVCRPGAHRDPHHLVELIERHGVEIVYLIPTLLQAVLDTIEPARCPSLRWVLSGGEPITPRLRDAFHARLGAGLVNGYGPTETGCATDMVVPAEPGAPTVPLGRPAANFRLYVLDRHQQVLPVGVPGEAYLGAEVGITHGYWNRPGLTAEAFLPDPFGPPGSRMYRTGDVCRYRADGVLEHLGRIGRQVKVRGVRVELAEVEAALVAHDGVEEAVALTAGQEGHQELVAFVVPRPGAAVGGRELVEHAATLLPRGMVPSTVQPVEEIPVSVNGKTDHRALLASWRRDGGGAGGEQGEAPAGPLERELAAIFAGVLGREAVGATDSFFDLGGHSLLVFKLIARCERELRLRLRVTDVFTAPTVRELARVARSVDAGADDVLVPLAPSPGKPLVVLVHGASGSALPFRDLAARLGGDCSVYGVQAPESGGDRPVAVGDLAGAYVDAVDPVRGLSPVVLAGWSMGGCVALEMARAWRDRGVDVTAVCLLDTWPPPAVLASAAERRRVRALIEGLDVFALEGLDVDGLGEDAEELARLQRVVDRNRRAYLDHRPAGFGGTVYLLRATETLPALREAFAALRSPAGDHGWAELVGPVVTREVPGNHFTLLREDGGAAIASVIREVAVSEASYLEL